MEANASRNSNGTTRALNFYKRIIRIDENTFSTFAPARLDLRLEIVSGRIGKLLDIKATAQTVSICDHVTLIRQGSEFVSLEGSIEKRSKIKKVLTEMEKATGKSLPCTIILQKSIPDRAGLGSNATSAAAVMRLANHAFELGLGAEQLENIAMRVSHDIMFAIRGGKVMIEGAERKRVTRMEEGDHPYFLIASPRKLSLPKLVFGEYQRTGAKLNDIIFKMYPESRMLMEAMDKAMERGISGTGPTVYGAYPTFKDCHSMKNRLEGWNFDGRIFIAEPIGMLQQYVSEDFTSSDGSQI
jgi:4-diphosphocytidyl-2-C-methyl-D-erythritol kinase